MKRIFEGIRVLDLGRFLAAPYAATLLADLGAEVIRVERSEGEDDRILGLPTPSGDSYFFMNIGRNKKCITLNYLTSDKAFSMLMELIGKSDVFIHNYTPGVAKKLGIDYEKISAVNPRIVYAENSAFGSSGPYANRLGFDQVAQAFSGAMSMTGYEDLPPLRTTVSYVDYCTAMLGAFGIASGLYQRAITGRGIRVETSLLDTAIATNATALSEYDATGKIRTRKGNMGWYGAPSDAYVSKDGKWIIVSLINHNHYVRFCEVIGREDLGTRQDLQTAYDRFLHLDELEPVVKDWMGARTHDEVEAEFRKAKLPFSRVYEIPEVLSDPQVINQQSMVDVDCRESGRVKVVGTPVRLGGEPPHITLPPPRLGEHNRDIYCGLMGYTEAEVAKMAEDGVI